MTINDGREMSLSLRADEYKVGRQKQEKYEDLKTGKIVNYLKRLKII